MYILRIMCYSEMTQAYSEKEIPSSPNRSRTYDLPITSSDALPLSYKRLVGAKAIKLGPCICITVHPVPKFRSCNKAIMVTTGRAHCIHNCILCSLFIQFEHSLDWVESLVRGVHYWHICFAHCSQFEHSRDSTMQSNNV